MDKTCGNCKLAESEKGNMIRCKPDLLPAEWHLKADTRSVCKYFEPRYVDVHIVIDKLVAEYYSKDPRPICVVAHGNGMKFMVDAGHVNQVRIAGWGKCDYFYTEQENRYRRETWTPPKDGAATRDLTVIVNTCNQIR